MAAYTDEGGNEGPEFTFNTPKFGKKNGCLIVFFSLKFHQIKSEFNVHH